MTEKEYRELPSSEYFSYSYIKRFDEFGPKSLIENIKIDNKGTHYGGIVHMLSFLPDNFDDKYFVSETEKELTETEIKLLDEVKKNIPKKDLTKKFIHSDKLTKICLLYIKELELWKNIKDEEKLKEKINDNFRNHLYKYTISEDKEIVSPKDFLDAKQASKTLTTHKFTSEYFTSKDIKKKQVLFEIPILYKIKDDNYKSLLDIILIDHENKKIRVVDLKTGAIPNAYFKYEFFKRRYDIQAFLYTVALEQYILENNLKDYMIDCPLYVFISRFSMETPLVFEVNENLVRGSYIGFESRYGKEYKGIEELVSNIKWHFENNIFNCTREEYEIPIHNLDFNVIGGIEFNRDYDNSIFNNFMNFRLNRETHGINLEEPMISFSRNMDSTTEHLHRRVREILERSNGENSVTRIDNDNQSDSTEVS